MRQLTLIRHAKSSHDHPGLPDKLRPLNDRGLHDAPLVGQHLKAALQFRPHLMVSSPASASGLPHQTSAAVWRTS